MSEENDNCKTCEHERDSSNEYCGSCGTGIESNWQEAGWIKGEKIKQLEQENDSLKRKCEELERALRIESNEPEERSQEANHYNWLEDQNEKLKALAEKMAEVLEWIERFYQMECNDSVSNQLVEVRNRAKSALAAYRKEMEGK